MMIIGVNDMISLSQDTTEQQPEPSSRHLYSKFQTIQCLDNIDDEKEDDDVMMKKKKVKTIKKVIKGLKKASASHKKQAKTLSKAIK